VCSGAACVWPSPKQYAPDDSCDTLCDAKDGCGSLNWYLDYECDGGTCKVDDSYCKLACGAECVGNTGCPCGKADGCVGDSYYTYPTYGNCTVACTCDMGDDPGEPCAPTADNCSDCSCSCGGYDVDESIANGNCSDGKDNDCDGFTDAADPGCASGPPPPPPPSSCSWEDDACGAVPCAADKRRQICEPSDCVGGVCVAGAIQCVADPICASGLNDPPNCVSLTAVPTSGDAPLAVGFTGAGNDSDGSIVAYQWDFNGDGAWDQTTAVNTVSYTYDVGSIYSAKLRVQDDEGDWSTTPAVCVKTITVTVAGAMITPPLVTTNNVTNVKKDSATLNGMLDNLGNAASCLVWFEWGTTPAYGNSTSFQTLSSISAFSADISGLDPNTTYYFRARAKNGASW